MEFIKPVIRHSFQVLNAAGCEMMSGVGDKDYVAGSFVISGLYRAKSRPKYDGWRKRMWVIGALQVAILVKFSLLATRATPQR